jgi:hypothetical protein
MPAPWIGAHVTADPGPWLFQNQLDQLNNMQASVCRIPLFWGGVRRFGGPGNDAPVDALMQATDRGPHIIVMSSETPELDFNPQYPGGPTGWAGDNGIVAQWNVLKYFARKYPNRTWTFELGNEPDGQGRWASAPEAARDHYLSAFNWCNGSKPGNVMIGISQPLDVWNNGSYWSRFNQPNAQNQSPIYTPDVCCVHLYMEESPYSFCPWIAQDPLRPIRWIRSWESGKGKTIFVTEAGLDEATRKWDANTPSQWERGNKYVDLALNLQQWSNELGGTGWCDVVCFYYVGYSEYAPGQLDAALRINEQTTPPIANRSASVHNC